MRLAKPKAVSLRSIRMLSRIETRQFSILPYLLLLPTILFIAAFTLWPAVFAGYSSLFKANQAVRVPQFTGLGNYTNLFQNEVFRQVFLNSILFAAITTPIAITLAFLFALLLNQKLRAIGIYRLMIFHPTVMPMVSAATIFLFVFAPEYGLLNEFLRTVGIKGPSWLGSFQFALISIMIITIWKQAGYLMIFYLAGLQNMSSEYIEAAKVDGANWFQGIRHITFPLLKGTTLFVTTIALVDAFQAVDQIYILTKGGPDNASNMLLFFLYELQFIFLDSGAAYALTTILLFVLLIATLLNFRLTERGANYE